MINGTETSVININSSITSVNFLLTGDGNVAEFTNGEGKSLHRTAIKQTGKGRKGGGGGARNCISFLVFFCVSIMTRA